MRTLLGIVYIVIGVVLASGRGYLSDINGLGALLSAALAILLWPLLLLGVKFRIGGGPQLRDSLFLAAPAWRLMRRGLRAREAPAVEATRDRRSAA